MQFLTKKQVNKTLAKMQQDKSRICISIIVPTHRLSPDRRTDQLILEKAIKKVKDNLQLKYSSDQVQPLIKAIDELVANIDFTHSKEGIGIFVSDRVKMVLPFSFPVTEKLIVAESFELRDVFYEISYSLPYYVLFLTEDKARLYKGKLNELTQVRANNFPLVNADLYEYNPPASGTTYTGDAYTRSFEHDKSVVEEKRYQSFLHKVDDHIKSFMKADTPLIICGVKKEIAYFKMLTQHKQNIIGQVTGNYQFTKGTTLAQLVWPVMKSFIDKKAKEQVKEWKEKEGAGLAEAGIQNVWQQAKEGKGLRLLVEKDFRLPGFLLPNNYRLYLRPPKSPHKILFDAVENIIELILEKNGEVVFVDNGSLKLQQHIALINRY